MSTKAPSLTASRIANGSRVPQAADDTSITNWPSANPIVLATQLDEAAGPWTAAYILRWRDVDDSGSFAPLGTTGECKYTTATDLTNGNAVTSGEAICTNDPHSTWQEGEEVEDGAAASFELPDEYYTELQWAISFEDAEAHEYEFEVYDQTNGAAIDTVACTVTILAATPQSITPSGIASAEAFGSLQLGQEGELVNLDHEEGDFSEYDTLEGDAGTDMSIAAAAALGGTNYGVAALIDDGNLIFARKGMWVQAGNEIRFRFYIDPSNLSIASGDAFGCQRIHMDGTYNFYTTFFYWHLRNNGGTLECRPVTENDDDSGSHPNWTTFTNQEHYIEIHIVRESADGQADGTMDWWIDGSQQTQVTGIENYNVFPTIAHWDTGITWWDTYTTTSGTIYFDEIVANNTGDVIGPVGGGAQTITPTGLASTEALGAITFGLGAVAIEPSGLASLEALGSPALGQLLSLTGVASAETMGTIALSLGTVTVDPIGLASAEAFGTITFSLGIVTVDPTGLASAEAFGTALLIQFVTPAGLASTEALGAIAFGLGPVAIEPSGLASEETLGATVVTGAGAIILPSALSSAEGFGTALLILYLTPTGLASAEALGAAQLNLHVLAQGIVSGEALGSALVRLIITATGLASGEAFGSPTLRLRVEPTALSSGEAFGSQTLVRGAVAIEPSALASSEALGAAQLVPGTVAIEPVGVASAEAMGTPLLVLYVTPSAIGSGEAMGNPIVILGGDLFVYPVSIGSTEGFGIVHILGAGGRNLWEMLLLVPQEEE